MYYFNFLKKMLRKVISIINFSCQKIMSVFRVLGIYNFMMSQHICLEIDLFFLIIIISGVNIVGKLTCEMQKKISMAGHGRFMS